MASMPGTATDRPLLLLDKCAIFDCPGDIQGPLGGTKDARKLQQVACSRGCYVDGEKAGLTAASAWSVLGREPGSVAANAGPRAGPHKAGAGEGDGAGAAAAGGKAGTSSNRGAASRSSSSMGAVPQVPAAAAGSVPAAKGRVEGSSRSRIKSTQPGGKASVPAGRAAADSTSAVAEGVHSLHLSCSGSEQSRAEAGLRAGSRAQAVAEAPQGGKGVAREERKKVPELAEDIRWAGC